MKKCLYSMRVIKELNVSERSQSFDFCSDCLQAASDLMAESKLDADGWPTVSEGDMCDSAIDEGYKCCNCKRIFTSFDDRIKK